MKKKKKRSLDPKRPVSYVQKKGKKKKKKRVQVIFSIRQRSTPLLHMQL